MIIPEEKAARRRRKYPAQEDEFLELSQSEDRIAMVVLCTGEPAGNPAGELELGERYVEACPCPCLLVTIFCAFCGFTAPRLVVHSF
jgi:hypothetical protein